MALKDVLEPVGLGTPFYLAYATYWFFNWLDRNASAQATRAISGWLKGEPYRRIDVHFAIIAAFDLLYTSPLFRIRAFVRSTMLSCIVVFAYIVYLFYNDIYEIIYHGEGYYRIYEIIGYVFSLNPNAGEAPLLSSFILSDYISLFCVRKCLYEARNRLLVSLFLAATMGGLVITACYAIGLGAWALLLWLRWHGILIQDDLVTYSKLLFGPFLSLRQEIEFMLPALLVYLWLPLFAIGALGVRLLYPIFRAVEWAQWFIKRGNQHPLRAMGWVAAVLVFAAAAIGKALPPPSAPRGPAPSGQSATLILNDSTWDRVNVEVVITNNSDCDNRGKGFVETKQLVMTKNRTQKIEAPNGESICWRHDRNPNNPVPGGWSGWSRVPLSPGQTVETDL
jgi:hypothetical protein